MKTLTASIALVGTLTFGSVALAGPNSNKCDKGSGSDAFRESVMACLVSGLPAGHDPVTLTQQCVAAVQDVWEASYPNLWNMDWPNWTP